MRSIAFVALLVVSGPAYAGGFAEFGGGLMVPAGDDDWTNYTDPSPKFFLRGGFVGGKIGGMLAFDWTPMSVDNIPVIGSLDVNAHRFRILGDIVAHIPVAPKLTASARFGLGLDIQHISLTYRLGGFESTTDDTDTGLALEPAGGIWYQVGDAWHVGGELAVPMSFHSYDDGNDIRLNDFTSIDVDILIGLRYMSR